MARKHNARTLAHARERGWIADRCHYFVSFRREQKPGEKFAGAAGRAVDLFGLADSAILDGGTGTLYIQSAGPNDSATGHLRKYNNDLETLERAAQLLKSNRFQIWEWKKVRRKIPTGRGGRASRVVWRAHVFHLGVDAQGFLVVVRDWWSHDGN